MMMGYTLQLRSVTPCLLSLCSVLSFEATLLMCLFWEARQGTGAWNVMRLMMTAQRFQFIFVWLKHRADH